MFYHTPLTLAVWNKSKEMFNLLLSEGADINSKTTNG